MNKRKLLVTCLVLASAFRQSVERGTLPASWLTGASCPETPPIRVHEYNPDFFILRQSGCTNFEKPFLYLIFGQERVLLVDTGAETVDVAGVVDQVIGRWRAAHGGRSVALVVVHSHGHSDHVAGDAQFRNRANTTVVEASPAALTSFFGLQDWPNRAAAFALGDRVVDVMPIPGHEPASIALYDRRTGILLTGDTLYPGRLYVRDAAAFAASIRRLVEFTRDKPIAHILGAHIENARTPFVDYPQGTRHQPDEHALELGRAHLLELDEALTAMGAAVMRRTLRDFTIWPLPPR
ncbi:MAG TPA: MBL fold metallo-hydrolase [Vicinamibacterales bacterium]|nr:MBL fold metallo-hydrolase [Vicinamibacterales bacterium]